MGSSTEMMWQARLLRDHPWLFFCLRLLALGRDSLRYAVAGLRSDRELRFAHQVALVLQVYGHWECITHLGLLRKKSELNVAKVSKLLARIEERKASPRR